MINVFYVIYVWYVIYVLVVIYMLHAIYVFKDVIYVIWKGVGGWCWRLIFRSSGDPGEPCKDKIGFLILTTWGVDTWIIPGGSPDHWSLLVLLCEAGLLVLLTLCLFCWGGKWELCLKYISYQLNFGSNQMVFWLQQYSESHFFGTPSRMTVSKTSMKLESDITKFMNEFS